MLRRVMGALSALLAMPARIAQLERAYTAAQDRIIELEGVVERQRVDLVHALHMIDDGLVEAVLDDGREFDWSEKLPPIPRTYVTRRQARRLNMRIEPTCAVLEGTRAGLGGKS